MSARRAPSSAWLRFATWIALIALGILLLKTTPLGELLTEERLTSLFDQARHTPWAPWALIGLYLVLAPLGLPISPLIAGGAVFGGVLGTVYSTVGLFLGAALSYLVAKLLGRELVVRLAGRRLRRVERIFGRDGFWPLVQSRFLPMPYSLVNFGAALAGVRLPLFLSSAAVGLFGSTLVHTCFIAALISAHGHERALVGAAYLATLVAMNVVLSLPSWKRLAARRRRYREILAARARRARGSLVALLLLLAGCATVGPTIDPLPEVDLDAPAWTVRTGQALWKRQDDATPLAGEVLVARHQDGDVLVSFSKPPLPLFTARTAGGKDGAWRIDFVRGGRAFSGHGRPPKRFVWFALPGVLAGGPAPKGWRVERPADDEWLLTSGKSGETIRLVLDPEPPRDER